MRVTVEIIKSLNPCKSRFDDNFLIHYPDFNGSFDEFIDLDKISYDDKIWVAKRFLNKNQLVHFGLLCAESVLYMFEEKYPEDKRVRDCIEYLKTIPDFSNLDQKTKDEIWQKRNAAAYAAADAADAYAAYATAYAANAAAGAAYAAADAAADAAAGAAAYAAAYAAADAASAAAAYAAADAADAAYARTNQQNLNIQFLKMAGSL